MSENFVAPGQQRYTRACMVCSIIMTYSRFKLYGCPNCPFLQLKDSPEAIESCTSQVFEGVIAMGKNRQSWIAKWQRLDNCVNGVYAIKVSGTLPDDIRSMLEDEGHPYVPRDGSATEQD